MAYAHTLWIALTVFSIVAEPTRGADSNSQDPATSHPASGKVSTNVGTGTAPGETKSTPMVYLFPKPGTTSIWIGVDRDGKTLFEVPCETALGMSHEEGLAIIGVGLREKRRWGAIDVTGKTVIPATFEHLSFFREGLAAGKKGDLYGYVDTKGAWAIKPRFARAYSFSDGLALVQEGESWRYIDKTGRPVIKTDLERPTPRFRFNDGLAIAWKDGRYGYMDKTGRIVVEPVYENAGLFSEGLGAVKVEDKWGYVDRTGKMVIGPQFVKALEFHEGRAAVCGETQIRADMQTKEEKWGVIDREGRVVVKPQYARIGDFSDGMAMIEVSTSHLGQVRIGGGKTAAIVYQRHDKGYINREGKLAIAPNYDSAQPFVGGRAQATTRGKSNGLIDKTGTWVWKIPAP